MIGRFVPAPRPEMSCPETGISDEELERQINDPATTWVTPEDVTAHLREIDRCSP